MRVLVLGGTRFMGHFLVYRLLAAGHHVTLLNRGATPDRFGDRVARVRCDRAADDLAQALVGREFDAAVDFTAYTAADGRAAARALAGGRVGHYVMISTGSVYLVREGCPRPSRERDYDGPLLPEPEGEDDRAAWAYGMNKRGCEAALAAAFRDDGFPATVLRIPMVNGERDPHRRLERYVARVLDGGPLLVPDGGGHAVRHVYSGDVVRAIVKLLLVPSTFGQAYNLCMDERPTLAELLALVAELLGAPARLAPVDAAALRARGIDPVAMSPFSDRWMSLLEPAKARAELGFQHTPLRRWLETVITSLLANPPSDPPPGYERRADEVSLAGEAGNAGRA
ncbi:MULTISPECIES: NAD-dependent epimerase/dehydratase family protein [Sorangium]|uniref:Epimerase n=1 Tax=Sorangium cellulosum TaxID=56 RepID=A0A4P2QL50_SORCE|nr:MULTISPECIES: NAD-dependent epimerase/dehydratase family protein [Sorangium]AUX30203.1 epimerase [Sorangium cellulosum]WCQ89594.1 nucleotide-sugar epimerase [Sorangium sp. Soce836]